MVSASTLAAIASTSNCSRRPSVRNVRSISSVLRPGHSGGMMTSARVGCMVMPRAVGRDEKAGLLSLSADAAAPRRSSMFFQLSTWVLALALFAVIVGATALGLWIGRSVRHDADSLREPFGVMQAALLGFMGLILAFGLSLAVQRYEGRRAAVVDEANAIGTTYLRAQTLPEPVRTRSLALLRQFTDISIRISETVPGSRAEQDAIAESGQIERELWALAGQALEAEPTGTAVRLYVESLNETFDSQSSRVYGLTNRVPTAVLVLVVTGTAVALGLLALYLTTLGRGALTVVLAAVLVTLILVVTFDLDRPTRGLIRVPATPLIDVRQSMALPPPARAGR
jgi:hypothetical protein